MEGKLVSKFLYKIELYVLKILNAILASLCFIHTVLSYFNIDVEELSYIAGIGLIPLAALYLTSIAFRFCAYHRMFLHYVLINNIICYIDYEYGIPIDSKEYLLLHCVIAFIFFAVIFYMKFLK
jgi:hypothetical protein